MRVKDRNSLLLLVRRGSRVLSLLIVVLRGFWGLRVVISVIIRPLNIF